MASTPRSKALAAGLACSMLAACSSRPAAPPSGDRLRDLQTEGVQQNRCDVVHWGPERDRYVSWHHHTNRLVPVYTYGTRGGGPGVDLDGYLGANSIYRDPSRLRELYGREPVGTVNPRAAYMDQTQLADLQRAAFSAGRRYIFIVIFDGMGWNMARAAAIHQAGRVAYDAGRGSGLHFLDYTAAGTAQFGYAVTSSADDRTAKRVDTQEIYDAGSGLYGGYDPVQGGFEPWTPGEDARYVIEENFGHPIRHAVTDSAAAATALFAGVKTYNGAINIDPEGRKLRTLVHEMQSAGHAVGIVTSVPISHATLAGAYAHNVTRMDYQDLTRDLLGLPSVAHPRQPLAGVDVLIGCGHGEQRESDRLQGANFVPGNRYLTAEDQRRVDVAHGGRYFVAVRSEGVDGATRLAETAALAARERGRLLGFYGTSWSNGHLPYRTANGDFVPAPSYGEATEVYSAAERLENPTLEQMTAAALSVLAGNPRGFWLLVEAGDVDWASHDANLDNAIGAVKSGDAAVRVITDWVEAHSDWSESLLIVTADHAHYLVIEDPEGLIESRQGGSKGP